MPRFARFLSFSALSLGLLLTSPAMAEGMERNDTILRPELVPMGGVYVYGEAPPDSSSTPRELTWEEFGDLLARSITNRELSLLLSLLVVGVVAGLRWAGAKVLPVLDTERGKAALALVGGTATLMALALSQGQPFSLGLLVSCLMGALSASGLWSVGKSLVRPKATPGQPS